MTWLIMNNKTCKKCIHLESDLKQSKHLLNLAHNEIVRLKAKEQAEQSDLDDFDKLKTINSEPATITEEKAWYYMGIFFMFGLFFGALVMWRGY